MLLRYKLYNQDCNESEKLHSKESVQQHYSHFITEIKLTVMWKIKSLIYQAYVYNQFSFENLIVYTRYIKYEAKAENTTDIASKIYTGTRINAQWCTWYVCRVK